MKSKKLTGVLLLLALLLVLAFAGYEIVKKKHAITPTDSQLILPTTPSAPAEEVTSDDWPEQLKVGVIDLELVRYSHPKIKILDQLDQQIKGYLREQGRQQEELSRSQKQIESQYSELNTQLTSQIESIHSKYQKEIDAKVAEFQQILSKYEEEVYNQTKAEVEQKQASLLATAQDMVKTLQQRQLQKLAEVEKELDLQYSPQLINLRLKLGMVQLNPTEKKNCEDQIEKIQIEKEQKLNQVKAELEAEGQKSLADKESLLDKELQEFQEQKKADMQKALEEKQAELEKAMQEYIASREKSMQAEMNERQNRLEAQTKDGLFRAQEQIQQEIKKNDSLLTNKIAETRAKQQKILDEIDAEIMAIVKKLAEEQGLDTVLVDVRVNVKAVDLTEQVLNKLNQ